MAESPVNKKTSQSPWDIDWLETQRQYMDAWKSFSRFIPAAPDTAPRNDNPWAEAMDHWWRAVSPSAPQGSHAFMSKMLEQGKVFYMLAEQFTRLLNGMDQLNKVSEGWEDLLRQQIEEMKTLLAGGRDSAGEAWHGMLGAWQLLPLDTLQRTFSSASLMPGDFLQDLKPEALEKVTDKFLSIPGVGYTRESQEQIQEAIRLWGIYQKACQEYHSATSRICIDTLDCMHRRILDMNEQGKELRSLREIYDLWVDCSEEAYAAFTGTEEFSELYGHLTNSLMAVKQHGRNIIDEALSALNMPTRRGISTMQKRQQELRRDWRSALNRIRQLEEKIGTLHQAAAARRAGGGAAAPATPKKREAGKKKAAAATIKRKKPAKVTAGKRKAASARDDMIVIKI